METKRDMIEGMIERVRELRARYEKSPVWDKKLDRTFFNAEMLVRQMDALPIERNMIYTRNEEVIIDFRNWFIDELGKELDDDSPVQMRVHVSDEFITLTWTNEIEDNDGTEAFWLDLLGHVDDAVERIEAQLHDLLIQIDRRLRW